ncbi:shikimate dehydrogenase [Exiguobacterium oxidotolerans]|uniref:Shikimate dehydrogenase (NADP(+)) n=1 Tax=Exiguobacterium oxidotolerans TaxID=223958 RepID=A0A653IFQ5_9BACL|nr:shikimate dehydrogenase [Exiguobacterium oxidotolerans]VWX38097.1 shikimate 5-dehydrogenase [Exiguobacterium oxidotolerans]
MRFAVIGHPIAHSLSPVLHEAWLEAAGLFGCYSMIDVEADDLEQVVRQLRMRELDGINVTIPYKTAIIPFLDRLEPSAEKAGAVNTVYVDGMELVGANTDGTGFVRALSARQSSENILVIGAGGAARGIVAALDGTVTIMNRTDQRARALAAEFQAQAIDWSESPDLTPYDTIINTTSVGMMPRVEATPIELTETRALICDIIYRPTPTQLLRDASARGLATLDGVPMFVLQAAEAFERFTGHAPDLTLGEQVIRKQLEEY